MDSVALIPHGGHIDRVRVKLEYFVPKTEHHNANFAKTLNVGMAGGQANTPTEGVP